MRHFLGILLVMLLLVPSIASAHIVNDQNLYEDLQYSKAKSEIVYLTGLGVIPYEHGTMLFSPTDQLTRAELGFWAGAFYKLKEQGASQDEFATAAVEKGLLSSLEGIATYEDVNQALFQGKMQVDHPQAEVSREEFALFVYEHRNEKVEGKSLHDHAGLVPGPVGTVEKVSIQDKAPQLKLGDQELSLSAHPRVLNAAVDPATWEGRSLEQSWLLTADGQKEQLHILLFAPSSSPEAPDASTSASHSSAAGHDHGQHAHGESAQSSDAVPSEFPYVPIAVVVVLIAIVASFWASKRK